MALISGWYLYWSDQVCGYYRDQKLRQKRVSKNLILQVIRSSAHPRGCWGSLKIWENPRHVVPTRATGWCFRIHDATCPQPTLGSNYWRNLGLVYFSALRNQKKYRGKNYLQITQCREGIEWAVWKKKKKREKGSAKGRGQKGKGG